MIVSKTQKCLYTGAYAIQVTLTTIPAASPSKQAQLSCEQVDGIEIDGQPSHLLFTADITDQKVNFTAIYPIFLPLLGCNHRSLNFTLKNENHKEILPKNFHLELLINDICI